MIQSLKRATRLAGTVALPGDKSISHRYALLAAIAEGVSELRHFAASQDCRSTLSCLRSLGVTAVETGNSVTIDGRGLRGLVAPRQVLDAGNSGTTLRLLSGILAGHPFQTTITGDESLRGRPMGRIAQPLRLMGASVTCQPGEFPPLTIHGGRLKALRYVLPVASAQVKSCVLLAGLYGNGSTAVQETISTRNHTEVALSQFGATVANDGEWIQVEPNPALRGQNLDVPGDLSGAAFFLIAAALVPGSDLVLPGAGLNRRRRAVLEYLQATGLDLTVENETEAAGEPRGDLRVRYSEALMRSGLSPIAGDLVPSLIDEIPVLAVLGCRVAGVFEISDAEELRVKESDRIAAIVANLRAMGAAVEEKPDGLRIRGGQQLHGTDIETHGDHRIAMAFAVAGLMAEGETRIHQAECADVSFPGFFEALALVAGNAKMKNDK